jgi:hypothetical protein
VIYAETRSHDWSFLDGDDGSTVDPGDDEHLPLWTEAWDPALDILTSGSGTVVLAETIPKIPFAVPACLAEHGPDGDDCDVPVDADEDVAPYNAAMVEAAGGREDVTIVDPTPIVCPDGTCPALIGGEIVRRDDDHLTASFARAAAPALEAMLRHAGVGFDDR